jgi:hypothetical protein
MDTSFDIFDRLDHYWKNHSGDDIEAIVQAATSRGEPIDIRVDLCAADLEWRLRTGAISLTASSRSKMHTLTFPPRATDYRKLLSRDWDAPGVQQQLLEAEWIARSRFSDRPDVDDFARQMPENAAWGNELADLLDLICPLRLSFLESCEIVLQCHVPAQFVIGRANRNEAEAPAWNAVENRVIVANAQFRSLSRTQLSVRRVGVQEIELRNLSDLIPSKLENGNIKPGQKIRRSLPLVLYFTHFHVQIDCASDIVFSLKK